MATFDWWTSAGEFVTRTESGTYGGTSSPYATAGTRLTLPSYVEFVALRTHVDLLETQKRDLEERLARVEKLLVRHNDLIGDPDGH